MRRTVSFLVVAFLFGWLPARAQAQKAKFIVTGFMSWEFLTQQGAPNTFDLFHFSPIFLFQANDKLLTRAEVEFEHGRAEIGLEYAQLDYLLNDYVTISGGKFLVPFGAYNTRLHPDWIAKLPTMPLADDRVVPVDWGQAGVMASGAVGLSGYRKVNYAAYVVNGLEGEEGGDIPDLRKEEDDQDLVNNNKAVGGRLGIVPVKGVEVGFSGYTGKYDAVPSPRLHLNLMGVDAEFHPKDFLEFRGEFNQADQEVTDPAAKDSLGYLVKRGYYAQGAVKLAPTGVDLLNPVELVVRFSGQDFPGDAEDVQELSPGINYYVTNTAIVRASYRFNWEKAGFKVRNNQFVFQFAMGF